MLTIPSEPVLRDSEAGAYAFYSWHNIVLACWSQGGTGPAMQRMARLREAMAREHPQGVSVVYLVADGASLPTPEARVAAKQLMERYSEQRACLAMIILGEGFGVSARRAAITGAQAALRGKVIVKVTSRVEDIAEWLPAQHESGTGVHIPPEQFLSVLRKLSATL